MASPARLTASLAERTTRSRQALDAALTPEDQLQAAIGLLRSLTVLAGRCDRGAADKITRRAAESVTSYASEMSDVVTRRVQQLREGNA